MYADGNNERPGIEERYESACSAAVLKVQAEHSGPADVLIASAWSDSSFGGAIMRLHTAWLKVEPRPVSEQDVAQHATRLPQKGGKPDTSRARKELVGAYLASVKAIAEGLRGRARVAEQLAEWAAAKGIDANLVGPCITFWLAPQCPHCCGRGKHRMPDAPTLGAKCRHCSGSGKRAAPLGGGKILDRIEHAIGQWRSGTRKRLYAR